MSKLAVIDTTTGELTQFSPAEAKSAMDIQRAKISLAAALGNTEELERAIDGLLDTQADAVAWWGANVRNGRPGKTISESEIVSLSQAEALLGISAVQISRWRKKLEKRLEYRAQVAGAARKKLLLETPDNHRAEGTGENEWYTPESYVEAARKVMGGIDLDPASSISAQRTIKAANYFTATDNGLLQEWQGRVWLNPPYAQPLIGQFIAKLVEELKKGAVTSAVVLTHNYTDTAWFHQAEELAAAICFTRGRIGFVSPEGEVASPTQGQAFFYYGDNAEEFGAVFRVFGFIR